MNNKLGTQISSNIVNDLISLVDNPPHVMPTFDYYFQEWNYSEAAAIQEATDSLRQWIKDVGAVLELASAQKELEMWQNLTENPTYFHTSEERLLVVLKQIITRFEKDLPPKPHKDMPESMIDDFEEARNVFPHSARSAVALLRLALQKLCKELGQKGEHINTDIKSLVAKGIPEHIQQSFDIVRIVGNETVHPGTINVRDNPEIALELFDFINIIVEELIAKKKRIKQRYDTMPEDKLKGIKNRDKSSQAAK